MSAPKFPSSPAENDMAKEATINNSGDKRFVNRCIEDYVKARTRWILATLGITSVSVLVTAFLMVKDAIDKKVETQVTEALKMRDDQFAKDIKRNQDTFDELVKNAQKELTDSAASAKGSSEILNLVTENASKIENEALDLKKQLAAFSDESRDKQIIDFVSEIKAIVSKGGSLKHMQEETDTIKTAIGALEGALAGKANASTRIISQQN